MANIGRSRPQQRIDEMAPPRLLAVGGAHIDRRGRMSSPFVPGASIPGRMREDVGGGALNALRTVRLCGAHGTIVSVRGGDAAGTEVGRAIADAGIEDLSAIFLDRATPSYTALLDSEGDVVAALADMELYEVAFPKQMRRTKIREALDAADALLCDANLPAAALGRLLPQAAGKPVFAIAISPAKVVRFAALLSEVDCLFMNAREASSLCGRGLPTSTAARELMNRGLRRGVITSGGNPVICFDHGDVFSIEPPPLKRIADVTGAGDALAGATSVALLQGLRLFEAVLHGLAAALLAVESPNAAPDFSQASFASALALVRQSTSVR